MCVATRVASGTLKLVWNRQFVGVSVHLSRRVLRHAKRHYLPIRSYFHGPSSPSPLQESEWQQQNGNLPCVIVTYPPRPRLFPFHLVGHRSLPWATRRETLTFKWRRRMKPPWPDCQPIVDLSLHQLSLGIPTMHFHEQKLRCSV